MARQQSDFREKERLDTKEPPKYNVVMLNDDFTPMDLVVHILCTVFFKPENEANVLMLTIHNSGKAIVGTYSYDIANSKKSKAMSMARQLGYPLRVNIEPADND